MKITLLFFILALSSYFTLGQVAGYRNIALTDSSRHYKPGAEPGVRLFYRPVEIDCWYPSAADRTPPIRYGVFLQLFQQRANRFQDDTVYSGLASEVAQSLSAGLGITDTAILTSQATQSYVNTQPLQGRFPLIIYMCSYNGMSFENVRLFETLARNGYIVASITSVGRYPGNMTTDPADLREQVADGLFAIKALLGSGEIDSTKIGAVGYSWGGPAAFLLAENPLVSAVLSLDGSEMHYYGSSSKEDSDFDRLRPSLMRAAGSNFAYAYLESDGKQTWEPADSIFDLLPAFRGPKKYILFPGATHEDFSSLPSMAKPDSVILPGYTDFALAWFDNHLKGGANRLPRDSPYPVVSHPGSGASTIGARVLDAEDNSPLAYVNVGIPGKNVGTVTHENGTFQLDVNAELLTDSIAVLMAGYEKRMIALKNVPKIILLHRRRGELPEVEIISGKLPTKLYGNKTTSNVISIGFPSRFLGAEIGVRMSLGKHPRHLKAFHCHVSNTRLDSAVFRLNIYQMVNGNPVNILQRNILFSIGKTPGDYSVKLSGLNLVLKGDILVSLELLKSYSSLPHPGAVFFSAGFFNSGTWRRQTSQAEWKKARGMGVGFNLEAR